MPKVATRTMPTPGHTLGGSKKKGEGVDRNETRAADDVGAFSRLQIALMPDNGDNTGDKRGKGGTTQLHT